MLVLLFFFFKYLLFKDYGSVVLRDEKNERK